jgi:hypothetical protein
LIRSSLDILGGTTEYDVLILLTTKSIGLFQADHRTLTIFVRSEIFGYFLWDDFFHLLSSAFFFLVFVEVATAMQFLFISSRTLLRALLIFEEGEAGSARVCFSRFRDNDLWCPRNSETDPIRPGLDRLQA